MEIKEFLNPKSMMTPGLIGSLVMLITNTLWIQFLLPQKWVALGLSFLFAILTIAQYSAPFLEKVIYYFINALIIYSLAIGTNVVGNKMLEDRKQTNVQIVKPINGKIEQMKEPNNSFFEAWF